ncbi:MAG: carbonic anhydrase [Balneola sp.]|jgi:carbonic anhydrase|nr:carbonic anhydrase [Balneola sp.]MBE79121.1 carbonic anhydrase [Balneola sp.]HBX66239.1 carbonic anhydrase [Balneolaceae bacterium]|tara:strand:- start:336 stop:1076 length:741 start_codon:yes stop_codon:yes gene_type:complete
MKTIDLLRNLLPIAILAFAITACTNNENQQDRTMEENLFGDVMTSETRDALTPEEILQSMKEGNERFVNNDLTPRDYQAQVKGTAKGQYPEAIVLACVDSRVPVENVFDKGVGDIFVARVAGNFVNEDILGSAEFATAVAGSKVVVVLGHKSCGAVKAAIDGVEMGNITAMLEKIKPAVEMTENYDGDRSTGNDDYVTEVVNNNVKHTIEEMRENSSIIAELERNGDVVIAGAFYDLETGKVTFLD